MKQMIRFYAMVLSFTLCYQEPVQARVIGRLLNGALSVEKLTVRASELGFGLEAYASQAAFRMRSGLGFKSAKQVAMIESDSLNQGAEIVTYAARQSSCCRKSSFQIPQSTLKPVAMRLTSDNDLYILSRKFDSPLGTIRLQEGFDIRTFYDQPLRRTAFSHKTTPSHTLDLRVPEKSNGRLLELKISSPRRKPQSGVMTLPNEVEGEILHYKINSSGTKIEIQTSEAEQIVLQVRLNKETQLLEGELIGRTPLANWLEDLVVREEVLTQKVIANQNGLQALP